MSHLLDTNSFIDHLRKGGASRISARIAIAPTGSVYLCSVVLGELLYGAMHGGALHRASNIAKIVKLRRQHTSLPFDDAAAVVYGENRQYLALLGTPIGSNDLMIASIALSNQLILVTHNTREFSRVPGLKLEDWQ